MGTGTASRKILPSLSELERVPLSSALAKIPIGSEDIVKVLSLVARASSYYKCKCSILLSPTGFRILDEGQREVTIDNSLASRFKVDPREVLVILNGKDVNNSIAPL